MADVVRLGCCCRSVPVRKRLLECFVLLAIVGCGTVVRAQDAPKPQDEPMTTLHVYTNLLQVPVLVLGSNRERLRKPIPESKFSVSIDSGRWHAATHVRQEGDDPISLAILLDVSGDEADLMSKIAGAIADLAPLSLHPQDTISVYALDCSLIHSVKNAPPTSGELKVAVNDVLEQWVLRIHQKHPENCRENIHLWDTLVYIVGQMSRLPGRRVILAASQGHDSGSVMKWNEVRSYAQKAGVAIFGLVYVPIFATTRDLALRQFGTESPFLSVCELSGGMIFYANIESVGQVLQQFTTTVRERYIVEFPRPANSTPGDHGMEVRVGKSDYFIRAAGISVPIPDAALMADPTTVPSDPSRAPEMGTRKPMTKPQ
jgi:hypothetical protein